MAVRATVSPGISTHGRCTETGGTANGDPLAIRNTGPQVRLAGQSDRLGLLGQCPSGQGTDAVSAPCADWWSADEASISGVAPCAGSVKAGALNKRPANTKPFKMKPNMRMATDMRPSRSMSMRPAKAAAAFEREKNRWLGGRGVYSRTAPSETALLMYFRVFLAAAIVMVGFTVTGSGHGGLAMADEKAVVTALHDHVLDREAAYRHHDPDVSDKTSNNCSDMEHCMDCSTHCPAVALVDTRPISADCITASRFASLAEHSDPALLPPMERPPEPV